MLYKKKEEPLTEELFWNPTKEYRGAPFWAWNCKPEKDMMERQMKVFSDMGFGGFHIHSRTGLDIPYLGDEFMDDVKFCVEYAKKNKLLAWAYDEDRFPSGFAGGLVTKNKEYRYRELFLTFDERTDYLNKRPQGRATESYLIAKFDIVLAADGTLQSYRILQKDEEAQGVTWFAYLRIASEEPKFNGQTYVDTLNKRSIEEFCKVTHERYKEVVGEYFGDVIPSFFTDEPKTTYKKSLPFATDRRNLIFPWTDDFPETFMAKYGFDMILHIPELVWELPDKKPSRARYYYHRHVAERFTQSYSQTISDWCEANGVHLTGHMIKEPSLKSQTTAIGETMQPLSPFGIPGIDMLCDEREYTTAKQAQSVAHQYGREGVVSELYGVTNWDFDFRGHKLGGDWQAALGVTIRVPHLSWMTMEGEAKRDYPASIHYQSPWYKKYKYIEDYFARVNTAMTRGKAVVKIAMLHPVESYWLHWGTEEHTSSVRKQLDENFQKMTEWLLYEHLDFDYISESLLADSGSVTDGKLSCGEMQYDVVLVPGCHTIRETTLQLLEQMVNQDGKLFFVGNAPALVEGSPSTRPAKLADNKLISMEKNEICDALAPYRTVRMLDKNGNVCNKLIYQLRKDGEDSWLFVVHGKRKDRYDVEGAQTIFIHIPGECKPLQYDAITGEIKKMKYKYENGETIISHTFYVHDSLLMKMTNGHKNADVQKDSAVEQVAEEWPVAKWKAPFEPAEIILSEPNVYLLDMAEFAVDENEFEGTEEVLRIGTRMREKYEIAPQTDKMAQPWTMEKKEPNHTLKLRYVIESDIHVSEPKLALEHPDLTTVIWNGKQVDVKPDGYYVDEKIQTIPLPPVRQGENELILSFPFGEGTDVENSFLLGDFGVQMQGCNQKIISPVRTLSFGNTVPQGLPFYGGNITYKLPFEAFGDISVRMPYYRGSLITAGIDKEGDEIIAFAPYKATLPVTPGEHVLYLTIYGNRVNTFGAVHNCNEGCSWFGPDAWRTRNDCFSYEYQLKKFGILKYPDIC